MPISLVSSRASSISARGTLALQEGFYCLAFRLRTGFALAVDSQATAVGWQFFHVEYGQAVAFENAAHGEQ